jgi:SAM-dependent methyltransferase
MSRAADVDEVMYACGAEVLHPGGLERTDEMARMCHIGPGKAVLDVGAGRGASACHLARKYGCHVTGVDTSRRMVRRCRQTADRERALDRTEFVVADACALPFTDSGFDLVIAECVTTLTDRARCWTEMVRVTKPGGYVGDLEMTWREPPPGPLAERTHELWDGYQTMTALEWRRSVERLGLQDVQVVDFSSSIANLGRAMRQELGLRGMVQMGWQLIRRADLRRAMYDYYKVFHEYGGYIGCAYFVGRKPAAQ